MRKRIAELSTTTNIGRIEAIKDANKLAVETQYVSMVTNAKSVTGRKIIYTPINTTVVTFTLANKPNLGTTLSSLVSS